ncbi:hypothetical protein ACQKDA_14820, partial [Psychrobacter sp. NPDC078370]
GFGWVWADAVASNSMPYFALFSEEDIPWDTLAFEAIRRTLKSYFADRKQYNELSEFPIHQEKIGKDLSIKRY